MSARKRNAAPGDEPQECRVAPDPDQPEGERSEHERCNRQRAAGSAGGQTLRGPARSPLRSRRAAQPMRKAGPSHATFCALPHARAAT